MNNTDIILIEDNSLDADLTIRAIKKMNSGLNIKHIEDGEEALDYLFARGKHSANSSSNYPKLIFLDLHLPKINGQEILKQVKANEETKGIPIVVLSSSSHNKDVTECYRLGANAYLVKLLDFEKYNRQIDRAMEFWMDINHLPA